MKWYGWLALIFLAFCAGWVMHWFNSPLGPRMYLETLPALPPEYQAYWGAFISLCKVIGGGFLVVAAAMLGVLIDLDVQARRLGRKDGAGWR